MTSPRREARPAQRRRHGRARGHDEHRERARLRGVGRREDSRPTGSLRHARVRRVRPVWANADPTRRFSFRGGGVSAAHGRAADAGAVSTASWPCWMPSASCPTASPRQHAHARTHSPDLMNVLARSILLPVRGYDESRPKTARPEHEIHTARLAHQRACRASWCWPTTPSRRALQRTNP